MFPKVSKLLTILAATGLAGTLLSYSPASNAFDFGNMMNPSKWMGGDNDRYDDGPYGGPWGGGPYGGGPWGGYGPGPYGPPGPYGAPGYRAAPPQAPAAPAASTAKTPSPPSASRDEVDALKKRIEELEAQQQSPAPAARAPSDWSSTPPPSGDWGNTSPEKDWGAAPAFRPMGKY